MRESARKVAAGRQGPVHRTTGEIFPGQGEGRVTVYTGTRESPCGICRPSARKHGEHIPRTERSPRAREHGEGSGRPSRPRVSDRGDYIPRAKKAPCIGPRGKYSPGKEKPVYTCTGEHGDPRAVYAGLPREGTGKTRRPEKIQPRPPAGTQAVTGKTRNFLTRGPISMVEGSF